MINNNPWTQNRINRLYRYVCSHCLRTFKDKIYDENAFCWECGQALEIIPKEEFSSKEKKR